MEADLLKAGGQPALSVSVLQINDNRRRRLQQASASQEPDPPCSIVLNMKIRYTDMLTWEVVEYYAEIVYPPGADVLLVEKLIINLEKDPTTLVFTSFSSQPVIFEVYWGPYSSR